MGEPLIRLESVSKEYRLGGETVQALDKVSLEVAQGEFLAVTGPSGSGKSTLATVIGGLDSPSAGSVLVEGEDLSHMNDKKLSHYRNARVGFVFQSFNLQPNYTAMENVMLPLVLGRVAGKARAERAKECLEAVGLGERLKHLPSQLSGGQRQRVAIARALANRPAIIVADEPTGNLDSQRGEEIMDLLGELNRQGITLIVITHDPSVAKRATRVVSIKDGKLKEEK